MYPLAITSLPEALARCPGAAVYYKPGDNTDDTKFTAGDLTTLLSRGDIR
jgi:hypothetical protein